MAARWNFESSAGESIYAQIAIDTTLAMAENDEDFAAALEEHPEQRSWCPCRLLSR